MRYSKCVTCHQIVGWVGLMANLSLSALKLFVGVISGSQALMVDALYSAKDVATSLLILVGLKVSQQPIDREHPFGHGKVEFLLSGLVSLILMVVTGAFFIYSAEHLLDAVHEAPHLIALWTAIFSIGVNVFMHRYVRCAAIEINSPIVMTLAKHHHADAYSSVAVALGIIGSHYLGLTWLDHLVALGEGVHLLYLGGEVFWDSFQGLMDRSAPQETIKQIRYHVGRTPGVQAVEQLRTRRVGQEIWIDLVVGVDPEQSVGEARNATRRVEEALAHSIPHVGDVNVHFRSVTGSIPELDIIREEMREESEKQSKKTVEPEEVGF